MRRAQASKLNSSLAPFPSPRLPSHLSSTVPTTSSSSPSLSSNPLPSLVSRNLGDRSYEKRKSAALEIEHLIKEWNSVQGQQQKNSENIKSLISVLVRDFAYSTQSNHRKGGLIGLAATAIALMDDTSIYLELLLPPVLKCFTDQEARVRCYACEALYNITKVARGSVLLFFNEIFDGLCKLYADIDIDVKNGAQLLDRLIKDVVTECESFDVDKFIPLLKERIRIKNPFIRQLLVGWITVLDSVPDIDMLEFLPEYLSGLFDMLSDQNKEIRQQAYAALAELLREINQSPHVELGPMISILVLHSESKDNFTRLTVLSWIHEFIILGKMKILPFISEILGAAIQCISDFEKEIRQKSEKTNESLLKLVENTTNDKITIGPILHKVTIQLSNKWVPSRLAALRWISMLFTKFPSSLLSHLSEIFPSLLKTLQDPDDIVVKFNLEVLARISLQDNSNFHHILNHLLKLFQMERKFLEQRGSFIIRQLCELLDGEDIYRTIAMILTGQEQQGGGVGGKGASGTTVSTTAGSDKDKEGEVKESKDGVSKDGVITIPISEDLEFVSLMVQTLNIILLTSAELLDLRNKIKNCSTPSITPPASSSPSKISSSPITSNNNNNNELFISLYSAWIHNPISTFSLCLLSQQYELSSSLIFILSDNEITVGTLMQIDKMVQLIESPIFIHLRLQLLEPRKYPFLLKSLYGILMLLPQSAAFVSLRNRLESVAPIGALPSMPESKFATANAMRVEGGGVGSLDISKMMTMFHACQARHQEKRIKQLKEISLINREKEKERSGGGGGGGSVESDKDKEKDKSGEKNDKSSNEGKSISPNPSK